MKLRFDDAIVEAYPGEGAGLPLVLFHTFGNEGRDVWAACRELGVPPCHGAAVSVERWEDTLSPWRAERAFRGGADFGCGADDHVRALEARILPELRAALDAPDAPCYIAGYSFAGLFALYALYRTDAFVGAASVSGSLWFPGFLDFARSAEKKRRPRRLYLSLGDREGRAKNPRLATVEAATRGFYAHCATQGVDCLFEMNPGNHFAEPNLRLAKGIRWMLM